MQPSDVYEVLEAHLTNAVASTGVRRNAGGQNDVLTRQNPIRLESI
jgi:hypothetical protein